ncbi:hypothetical protein FKG94_12005 [Exilibacterium tricleocarpae]|uniref:TonB-dependent receptor n=1 Tax=Exilibacterium tricleocarpae TaxID=2591008 RepID=A0A545TNJ6_9GAMM|nr:TonB-dependent receptor [Exilibacterium tricleocarpae]TQV78741.1 hypothetical protein FKG94_12005 [Exilibacterium tricleocarpae]
MHSNNEGPLTAAVLLLLWGALPGQSAAANDVIEEVTVTGSHIRKKTGYEGSSPLTVVDKEAFKAQGVADLVDLAAGLTVNAGSIVSQETGGLIGTSQFNIRNLGAGSTLTLINGRRGGISTVPDAGGNLFFDNKQLPLAMIERVDVQTDGASTTYGSDAVGGVVNIITRKGFEGFELSARYQDASNEAYSVNLATGVRTDTAIFNLYATFYGQTRNHRTDFDWLVERIHGDGDLTRSRLISGQGSPGTYRPAVTDTNGVITAFGNPHIDADCEAAGGVIRGENCRYNFADQVAILPEEQRLQVFAEAEYDFSETTTLFTEISYSGNDIERTQGPNSYRNGLVEGGSLFIPAEHPFNFWVADPADPGGASLIYIDPANWDNAIHQAVDLSCNCRPQGLEANGRGDDAPFNRNIDLDYYRLVLGGERELSETWILTANYIYAESRRKYREENNWNSITLNASLLDGTFNPFGTSRVSPDLVSPKDGVSTAGNSRETLLLVMHKERARIDTKQQVLDIVASGDLFEINSGAVAAAVGAQYRLDERETSPDPFLVSGLGNSPEGSAAPSTADQDVVAVFGEVSAPVTDDLQVSIALRYEDYGDVAGSTLDPKLALRWEVNDSVAARASWGTAFQGPSIPQTGRTSATTFIDDAAVVNPVTGVLECGDGGDGSIVVVQTEGSDSLKPQSSENFNLGLIFSPTDDLRLSVDYWRFEYEDLITQDEGAQAIVDNDCADNGIPDDPRIQRLGSGQLRVITSEFINTGSVETDGVDLATHYDFPSVALGLFSAGLNLTYVNKFAVVNDDGSTFDGVGSRNFTNQFGSLPQWRAMANMGWNLDRHSANLVVRYIDSYENDQSDDFEVDSFTSVDLNYAYELPWDDDGELLIFKLGARNLFDVDPPSLGDGVRPAYDDRVHDVRGRILYAETTWTF